MTTNAATDPLIGRMIDQRYRVRSRIARGGMATVYLATDVRLERRVAIKIMHGHLADDANFRSRFIQEARSAARLGHPNVVGVFDQGQDADATYIVMEYIPGITLRDLLQEHRALTAEQALDILRAVLAGLASAHRAGIVHRDLKPENVLLADDGRIKLGDFGLARAASANTATGAALLGTIAYLSPELVTRGQADARSDIYAVGIMLYEMLTGEQPYKGEQPMQIAYQHANDTVPPPSAANPQVPRELDELVLWATARDPEVRPRDARAMLEQLSGIEDRIADPGLRRTTVIEQAGATAVLPVDVDPDDADTRVIGRDGAWRGDHRERPGSAGRPASAAQPGSFGQPGSIGQPGSAAQPGSPWQADTTGRLGGPVHPRDAGAAPAWGPVGGGAGAAAGARPTAATQQLGERSARRRRRGWILVAIVLALAVVAGGIGWWFGPGPGGVVTIPQVAGKSVSEARAMLRAEGLTPESSTGKRYDTVVTAGQVSATRPTARASVTRGTSVRILVSEGPRLVTLPPIVGQQYDQVRALLRKDFTVKTPSYRFDDTAAKGTVLAASGTGADGAAVDLTTVQTFGQRSDITMTVSLGQVPDVVGKSVDQATTALQGVGLTVDSTTTGEYSDTAASGTVLRTVITDDPVVEGSSVELVVSKGPAPIQLPDVTKKTINQAVQTLQALGLQVSYPDCTNVLCSFYDWKSTLPVTSTDPAAGSTVYKGDTITLSYKQ